MFLVFFSRGFVVYDEVADASAAFKTVHGSIIRGLPMFVMYKMKGRASKNMYLFIVDCPIQE